MLFLWLYWWLFSGADQEWVVVGGRELFPGGHDADDQHRVHDEFALDLANIVPGLGEVGIIGNHSMITSSSFHLLSWLSWPVQGGEPVVLSGHEATQAEVIFMTSLIFIFWSFHVITRKRNDDDTSSVSNALKAVPRPQCANFKRVTSDYKTYLIWFFLDKFSPRVDNSDTPVSNV